jgi:hypothetical protein
MNKFASHQTIVWKEFFDEDQRGEAIKVHIGMAESDVHRWVPPTIIDRKLGNVQQNMKRREGRRKLAYRGFIKGLEKEVWGSGL